VPAKSMPVLAIAFVAISGTAYPQAPIALGPPNATLSAELTNVASVRELADGRVLIADVGESKLLIGDWRTGTMTQIGRQGSGPGEYASPRLLVALAGDSTLLVDPRNRRWLLLRGAEIVETVGAQSPAVRNGGAVPNGADQAGHVLAVVPRLPGPGTDGAALLDSLVLIRVSRASGRVDTVGTMRNRLMRLQSEGPLDPTKPIAFTVNPLAVSEQATLFPDGTIAIARLAPYRVDWLTSAGARTLGGALPFVSTRLDDAEKRAVLAREANQSGRAARTPDEVVDWPDVVPPFLGNALHAAPDGRLWIRRAPVGQRPGTTYDVVDRRGQLAARISMNGSSHVVGLGRNAVFVVETDGDGVQRLQRRAMPAFR
jgi:hypothetical protein